VLLPYPNKKVIVKQLNLRIYMDYLIYTAVGIILIIFIVKYLNKLSVGLINLFWDGYRIFIRTGDEEAKVTIEIGLATVSKDHRQLLIDSMIKDINEELLYLHLSKQEMSNELKNQIIEIGIPTQITDEAQKEKLIRISKIKEIIHKFNNFNGDINESILLKSVHRESFPQLISAINISNRKYFRNKYSSFNEPNLTERIKIWSVAVNQQNK
jgi:hypothetical protein